MKSLLVSCCLPELLSVILELLHVPCCFPESGHLLHNYGVAPYLLLSPIVAECVRGLATNSKFASLLQISKCIPTSVVLV